MTKLNKVGDVALCTHGGAKHILGFRIVSECIFIFESEMRALPT